MPAVLHCSGLILRGNI